MKYIRMKIKFLDVSKMLQITVMHYRTFLVPIKLYKYIAWLKEGVHTNTNSSPGKKKKPKTPKTLKSQRIWTLYLGVLRTNEFH